MPDFRTQPDELAEWLSASSGGAKVEIVELPRVGSVLFRLRDRERSPFPELEVSEEAMEDWDLATISRDLNQADLPEWLRSHPSHRLFYGNDRVINHFETLFVRCSGDTYRVVRDAEGNVSFYDSSDKRVPTQGMRVLPTSIHRKTPEEWCEEITGLLPET